MCGIASSTDENVDIVSLLMRLGHRGQGGWGSALRSEKGKLWRDTKYLGSIREVTEVPRFKAKYSVGHTRYPTNGCTKIHDLQPFIFGKMAGVHNGNVWLIEEDDLGEINDSRQLLSTFKNTLDLHLNPPYSYSCKEAIEKTLFHLSKLFGGAYSCIVSSPEWGMLAFRDPLGIRPLEWGITTNDGVIFASETVAFPEGTIHKGSVSAGGYIWVDLNGQISQGVYDPEARLTPDAFEYLYFGHPDSVLNGVSLREVRERLGHTLGQRVLSQWSDKDFLVVPVPKTSLHIAPKVAICGGWEYCFDAITVLTQERTFIKPTQSMREQAVRDKFSISEQVRGKIILLVEDSIVRGTTLTILIQMIRAAGALAVYVVSACPPVLHPDFYGIAMPTHAELIAHGRSVEQVQEEIGADGLIYLTIEEMQFCILDGAPFDKLSMPYLDGQYLLGRP